MWSQGCSFLVRGLESGLLALLLQTCWCCRTVQLEDLLSNEHVGSLLQWGKNNWYTRNWMTGRTIMNRRQNAKLCPLSLLMGLPVRWPAWRSVCLYPRLCRLFAIYFPGRLGFKVCVSGDHCDIGCSLFSLLFATTVRYILKFSFCTSAYVESG